MKHMKQMKHKPLIYIGLLAVTGWFASQACFPIYRPTTPLPPPVENSPCPANSQGVCPSPSPR